MLRYVGYVCTYVRRFDDGWLTKVAVWTLACQHPPCNPLVNYTLAHLTLPGSPIQQNPSPSPVRTCLSLLSPPSFSSSYRYAFEPLTRPLQHFRATFRSEFTSFSLSSYHTHHTLFPLKISKLAFWTILWPTPLISILNGFHCCFCFKAEIIIPHSKARSTSFKANWTTHTNHPLLQPKYRGSAAYLTDITFLHPTNRDVHTHKHSHSNGVSFPLSNQLITIKRVTTATRKQKRKTETIARSYMN